MNLLSFLNIQITLAAILLFIGLYLCFGVVTPKLKGSIYHTSRITMGIAILILGVNTILFYLFNVNALDEYYASAINLVGINMITTLVTATYTPLVGHRLRYKSPQFIIAATSWIIYPMIVWGVIATHNKEVIITTHKIAGALYIISLIAQGIYFFCNYRKAIKESANFYSEDIEVSIKWIRTSILLLIILSIISYIVLFPPDYSIAEMIIYLVYLTFVMLYIFYSFTRFMVTYEKVTEACHIEPKEGLIPIKEVKSQPNKETMQHVGKQIEKWVAEKGYTQQGVTIQTLAQYAYSNRTYVSMYINTNYNSTFKQWIAQLRITEAKQELANNAKISIGEVATKTGFLSPTTFTHTFKEMEGMAPIKWRNQNLTIK